MRLFLASESPRRRELLKLAVESFEVETASVTEISASESVTPEDAAGCNAALKAEAVACRHRNDLVLGADTVVILDGKLYGKPRDLEQAKEFLRTFSGREHRVVTAVALRHAATDYKDDFIAESRVKFRVLSNEDIASYLALVPVLDKAGAYGIQDHGEMLVESITGELENIIGLPVAELRKHLNGSGFFKDSVACVGSEN